MFILSKIIKIGKKLLISLFSVIFLIAFLVFFVFSQLRPSLSIAPEETLAINMHINQKHTYYFENSINFFLETTFKIEISYFSEDLKLLTLENETIPRIFPYTQQIAIDRDRHIKWGFQIVAPNRPGNYTIFLRFILVSWIFSQEYQQRIRVNVEFPPIKEPLLISLDKRIYTQGEYINIRIKNCLNETIWFNNTLYELCIEKWDGTKWVLFKKVEGDPTLTSLKPGEEAQIREKLDITPGTPFPAGYYRVGTKEVYVEFTVIRPMT